MGASAGRPFRGSRSTRPESEHPASSAASQYGFASIASPSIDRIRKTEAVQQEAEVKKARGYAVSRHLWSWNPRTAGREKRQCGVSTFREAANG
jgi:hypothetical protein